jgi:hypothetical protein
LLSLLLFVCSLHDRDLFQKNGRNRNEKLVHRPGQYVDLGNALGLFKQQQEKAKNEKKKVLSILRKKSAPKHHPTEESAPTRKEEEVIRILEL